MDWNVSLLLLPGDGKFGQVEPSGESAENRSFKKEARVLPSEVTAALQRPLLDVLICWMGQLIKRLAGCVGLGGGWEPKARQTVRDTKRDKWIAGL